MTVQLGYRIPKEQKGCKYFHEYWEDVVGDGGQKMQLFECTYEGGLECEANCDKTCPAFEPEETTICKIHDVEYSRGNWCGLCFKEED